jgi:hypothetical protein
VEFQEQVARQVFQALAVDQALLEQAATQVILAHQAQVAIQVYLEPAGLQAPAVRLV